MRKGLFAAVIAAGALILGTAAVGLSSFDKQANEPQVAGVTGSDSSAVFPTNKQNEPSIAVDPQATQYLIAGSNDEQLQPACGPGPVRGEKDAANDCSFFPNVGTDGVYTSGDGGSTWTNNGLLPGFAQVDGSGHLIAGSGSLVSDGDPVIVFGPTPGTNGKFSWDNGHRAYYAGLASYASGKQTGLQAPELITVSTSDDHGASWSGPIIAANGHGYNFNDKDDIWADANPSSPFFGRVYVSWTQFRGIPGFAEPVMTAYSADGGTTWSRPNQVSIAQNAAFGGRQFTALRTGPDGTVYLVWLDSDHHGYKQVVATSHDGGVSWSHPRTIAYLKHPMSDPIHGANFRTGPYPSVAVSGSGTVYSAWVDENASHVGTVLVSTSADKGVTWSAPVTASNTADGYAFFQGLDVAPDGTRVDIGYQALTATNTNPPYGTGNATIDAYYVNSSDGTHWSTSRQVSTRSSDPAATAQNDLRRQFWGDYNTLVSTNAGAFFIYTDSRNGVGCTAVDTYQRNIDSGTTPNPKPAPENDCPASAPKQFGNSDIWVSVITAP